MTKIRCIDLETGGMLPADGVCEIGWCDVTQGADGKWSYGLPGSVIVNPEKPISPSASAVHHITNDDVKDAPALADAIADSDLIRDDIAVYCAHNSAFEQAFLPQIGVWGCTYKLAITYSPKAPGHKLQELRYWLKLDVDRTIADHAHRAGPDAYVCAALLARMLNKLPLDVTTIIDITRNPVLLPFLVFGKHAMQPCGEVPAGYWRWVLQQADMDPNVKHTAFHYLNKEREG